ncbi:MAG TPA: rhodanese-like domain-containing protein [Oculatellaceae cyanobacterium]|jgi:rhodanese-related sulfurtransferase
MSTLNPVQPKEAKAFFEEKMKFTTGPVETERLLRTERDRVVIVDVRAEEDYRQGHIPGAINLPESRWSTFEGLSKDKHNIVYCYSHVCHLAAKAALKFAEAGYPVMEMEGGWKAWVEHELPVER